MDIVSRIWSLALESWCFNWAFIEDVPPVGLALREMLGRGLPGGRNSATGKSEAAGEGDGLESGVHGFVRTACAPGRREEKAPCVLLQPRGAWVRPPLSALPRLVWAAAHSSSGLTK